MTVKEILNTAAALLRLDNLSDRETELLLRCFNLVYTEIACDYIPMTEEEMAESKGGKIEYASFKKIPLNIISVESGGVRQKFSLRPSFFTAPEGEVKVVYSYIPAELGLDDSVGFGSRISPAVFAYGTAAEYALINSEFDESQMWDKRYRDGLISACRDRREIRMPKRGWY